MRIKRKTVMSWSSWKKKERIVKFVLSKENYFNICVLSYCVVYSIKLLEYIYFTYQKTLLRALLLLGFKIIESLQCILKHMVWFIVKKCRRENKVLHPEAAIGGVLWKKVFLEISQNLQENTGTRVSFITKLLAQVAGSGLQLY